MQASEYLLNEYYPDTNIDTEIIVRSVANDVQRQQDYAIFKLKKRMLKPKENFKVSYPIIYWAQSVDDVLVRIVLHSEMDTPECKQSF